MITGHSSGAAAAACDQAATERPELEIAAALTDLSLYERDHQQQLIAEVNVAPAIDIE